MSEGFTDLTIVVAVTDNVAKAMGAWEAAAWVLRTDMSELHGGAVVGCGVFQDAFYEPQEDQ